MVQQSRRVADYREDGEDMPPDLCCVLVSGDVCHGTDFCLVPYVSRDRVDEIEQAHVEYVAKWDAHYKALEAETNELRARKRRDLPDGAPDHCGPPAAANKAKREAYARRMEES